MGVTVITVMSQVTSGKGQATRRRFKWFKRLPRNHTETLRRETTVKSEGGDRRTAERRCVGARQGEPLLDAPTECGGEKTQV